MSDFFHNFHNFQTIISLNKTNIIPCQPEISSYIVARDKEGVPCVFAVRGFKNGRAYWILRHYLGHPISYMFKDTGEFGYTDDNEDMYLNGFEHPDEAIEHFFKFYGR
jgi:hypothetical protein